MIFVAPDISYEKQAREYIQEFAEYGSSLHGVSSLDSFLEQKSYENWLEQLAKNSDASVKIPGRVNDVTFFYVEEETDDIIGMVNIRFGLNVSLFQEGGHVGYSIRPTQRGKGFATQMLQDALGFCRFIGLSKVLLICEKENVASARVIEKCGGVLENEVKRGSDGVWLKRYWVENE